MKWLHLPDKVLKYTLLFSGLICPNSVFLVEGDKSLFVHLIEAVVSRDGWWESEPACYSADAWFSLQQQEKVRVAEPISVSTPQIN